MIRLAPLLPLALFALSGCGSDPCAESGTICTWMGTGQAGLAPEGTCRLDATTYLVLDLTFGPDGKPYIMDWNNHRVLTVPMDGDKCDPIEVVTGSSLLGDGPQGDMKDAAWNHPTNLAFMSDGTMLMSAWHNSRIVSFDLDAGTCEFIAGTGGRDYGGDGGPATAAVLNLPAGVVVDDQDRIYVADQANQRIRRIETDGTIDTVVGDGTYGYAGDGGQGTEAEIANELSQAASPSGKMSLDGHLMYFADTANHRIRTYDIDSGIVDTFAGDGTPGFGGDGGDAKSAQLDNPRDVEVGPDGSVYIADTSNSCVRKVDASGTITTVAGVCGEPGFDGDEGAATEAHLFMPFGLETSPDGMLWIADTNNHVIRTVAP